MNSCSQSGTSEQNGFHRSFSWSSFLLGFGFLVGLVDRSSRSVRGLFSAIVPNSSYAEVRMGLLIEPTHMEDEGEDEEK